MEERAGRHASSSPPPPPYSPSPDHRLRLHRTPLPMEMMEGLVVLRATCPLTPPPRPLPPPPIDIPSSNKRREGTHATSCHPPPPPTLPLLFLLHNSTPPPPPLPLPIIKVPNSNKRMTLFRATHPTLNPTPPAMHCHRTLLLRLHKVYQLWQRPPPLSLALTCPTLTLFLINGHHTLGRMAPHHLPIPAPCPSPPPVHHLWHRCPHPLASPQRAASCHADGHPSHSNDPSLDKPPPFHPPPHHLSSHTLLPPSQIPPSHTPSQPSDLRLPLSGARMVPS
mmetsp:Transcript_20534/g.33818  ORF Transcript_20534/g.33818 Transcript_20534/m.33818 type:complete len:280 (-) Transcript_20534:35-874(-)